MGKASVAIIPLVFRRLIATPRILIDVAPTSSHSFLCVSNAITAGELSYLCAQLTRFYSTNIQLNQKSLLSPFELNNPCSDSSRSSAILLNPQKSICTGRATSASFSNLMTEQRRNFHSVGQYHDVADETLHSIQDGVEEFLEEHYVDAGDDGGNDIPEVNYASGVLTIFLPPHGTYVINKQTPNQQIWWSSPISGPRRYEYDENRKRWVNSRVVDVSSADASSGELTYGEDDTLGGLLNKEFEELFGQSVGLET